MYFFVRLVHLLTISRIQYDKTFVYDSVNKGALGNKSDYILKDVKQILSALPSRHIL